MSTKTVPNNIYYDIESLADIFTLAAYSERKNHLYVWYLLENQQFRFTGEQIRYIESVIRDKNKQFTGTVSFHNLVDKESNVELIRMFGRVPYENNKARHSELECRLVCDIDPDYDPDKHPFLMGYNSVNYDMTMLALYMHEIVVNNQFYPTTPAEMRAYNDELFHPAFKPNMPSRLKHSYVEPSDVIGDPAAEGNRQAHFTQNALVKINNKYLADDGWNATHDYYYIYNNMMLSGRHLDVGNLNEKQSRVGLKRLCGMLGLQILEADEDLSGKAKADRQKNFIESIASLFAYNASDVFNLQPLFHDKHYESTFRLKGQLLKDYPDVIYKQKRGDDGKLLYEPGIDPKNVKRNRLTINSTSAKFAEFLLAPYSRLTDTAHVTFMYPSEAKSKELGIPRRNILDETEEYINKNLVPRAKTPSGLAVIDSLRQMIAMYRNIEGKDFNVLSEGEIFNIRNESSVVYAPYMDENGEPSSCYVTFSIGGIHGAEYNKARFDEDVKAFEEAQALFARVRELYPDPLDLAVTVNDKGKPCKRKTFKVDGVEYEVKDFLASSYTMKKAEWKSSYIKAKRPELFPIDGEGKQKLNPKYKYTSFGLANHEDFTSYYPFLLINLGAFVNEGLGYDRYFDVYQNKAKFGKLMKDKSLEEEVRQMYSVMRDGTKLVLNAASGAADTEHKKNITVNNRIIAMRIIGQLFTWRIGQAQALEGARIVSTNTDGLYTIFDEERNNKILEREAEAIQVGIEPEICYLVSKDANNRFEAKIADKPTGNSMTDLDIFSSGGHDLACLDGPSTTKSLDHPAIIDWALSEYLKFKALRGALDDFEDDVVYYLLNNAASYIFKDRVKYLLMFQNVIASSPNKGTYNFATPRPLSTPGIEPEPIFMQHYNRVFYVDPKKVPEEYRDSIVYLQSAYMFTNPKGKKDADPLAIHVIRDLNHDPEILIRGTPSIKKINGISMNTPCIICNEHLSFTKKIEPEWLDHAYYMSRVRHSYIQNWQNFTGHEEKIPVVEEED